MDAKQNFYLVSAITNWDTKQEKRDKHHNPHFLGIALTCIHNIEEESPELSAVEVAELALNGRLLDYTLKYLAEHPG